MFDHFGENDAFFDEYLNSVLAWETDKALDCFRDLAKQLKYLPRTKGAA